MNKRLKLCTRWNFLMKLNLWTLNFHDDLVSVFTDDQHEIWICRKISDQNITPSDGSLFRFNDCLINMVEKIIWLIKLIRSNPSTGFFCEWLISVFERYNNVYICYTGTFFFFIAGSQRYRKFTYKLNLSTLNISFEESFFPTFSENSIVTEIWQGGKWPLSRLKPMYYRSCRKNFRLSRVTCHKHEKWRKMIIKKRKKK